MENLAQLQNWLRWIITHPRGVDSALEDSVHEPRPRLLNQIVDAPPVARTVRLDIYAEGYLSRLVEALANDFEHFCGALVALEGERAFRQVIADYLVAFPSRTKTICDVGQNLPSFLKTYQRLLAYPYLRDIAQMDWVATRTLYVDSIPLFDKSCLSTLREEDWAELKFTLDPTVHFLHSAYSVDKVWNHVPFEAALVSSVPTCLIIFRQNEFVFVQSISERQFQVLRQMSEGKTLGQICERLENEHPKNSTPPPIMEWFGQWTTDGVIRRAYL